MMRKSIVLAGAALLFVASPALAAEEQDAISYEVSASTEVTTELDGGLNGANAADYDYKLVGTADWGTLLLYTGDDDGADAVEDPLGLVSFARNSDALIRVTSSHFGPELVGQVAADSGLGLTVSDDVGGATLGAILTDNMNGEDTIRRVGGYVTVPVPVGDLEVSGSVATSMSSDPPEDAEPLAFGVTLTGEAVSNLDVEATYTLEQTHFDWHPIDRPAGETNLYLEGVYTMGELQGVVSYDHLGDAEDTADSADDTITASLAYRTGDADFDDVFDDADYVDTGSTGVKGAFHLYSGDVNYGENGDTEIELSATAPLADGLAGKVDVNMYSDEDQDTTNKPDNIDYGAKSKLGVDARLHYKMSDTVALIPNVTFTSYSDVRDVQDEDGEEVTELTQTDLVLEVEKALSESTTLSVSFTNESGDSVNDVTGVLEQRANNILGLGFSVSF